MIHANSDRIRALWPRKIPEGNGVVWDARKLACDDYIKNFCPYVFLGGPVRGLCWFAENDKGWGWNPATPNLEVLRENGKVVLRVHLINQPTELTRPQTLFFWTSGRAGKAHVECAGTEPQLVALPLLP